MTSSCELGPLPYRRSSSHVLLMASHVALVTLGDDLGERTESAVGDGPVNASFSAIDKITGMEGKLLDYTVRAITQGTDAVGEVFVHVEFEGASYTGKAASTDVVDASVRAYLNALNKAVYAKARRSSDSNEEISVATPLPQN